MIRKLLICPYFGETPAWMFHWLGSVKRSLEPIGYDVLMDTDEGGFGERVKSVLEINAPPMYGTGKTWDYRPALGLLYEQELQDGEYDFWGHTDFDCVYGRVSRFVSDDFLNEIDMHSNCSTYVNGCWSLYRNTPQMRELFMEEPFWQDILEDETPSGWAEKSFSEIVAAHHDEGALVKAWTQWQVYEEKDLARLVLTDDGKLMLGRKEQMMAHFRRTKVWPEGCR